MSDPDGPASDFSNEESSLNQPSAADQFADVLPETFNIWIEELKPSRAPVIAPESVDDLEGLSFEGTLRVDGYAVGRLFSLTGTLILSEGADVESEVDVATAIIDGVLHGNIHATRSVELKSHAKVFGNIESPTIAIQPGAVFEGRCHFLPAPF